MSDTVLLPRAVGPVSEHARGLLTHPRADRVTAPVPASDVDVFDDDVQLGLYMLAEVSYVGWADVPDAAETWPAVMEYREQLNEWFEEKLRASLGDLSGDPSEVARRLLAADIPSLSAWLRDHGTIDDLAESLRWRSPYQSKEADPHTFVIPRLPMATKRSLVEVQAGEYGVGYPSSHAQLFADALQAVGLDSAQNAHVSALPGEALATSNLVSLGSMRRRLRGVAIGQLALYEMESVTPNAAMVACCDRLGLPDTVRRFFQIHVLADAEHELIAAEQFLVEYPRLDPDQRENVVLGMRAQRAIDLRVADLLIAADRDEARPRAAA